MKLLETYLLYLHLQEKEWGEETPNPDSFAIKNFEDLMGQKINVNVFKRMRHHLQPSMYNIYIKNTLGDYMGRPDTMNSQTVRTVGFHQFKDDIENLKQKYLYAIKIKHKYPTNFLTGDHAHYETNDPGDEAYEEGDIGDYGSDSMGDDGDGDGGDGGDGDGGGGE